MIVPESFLWCVVFHNVLIVMVMFWRLSNLSEEE